MQDLVIIIIPIIGALIGDTTIIFPDIIIPTLSRTLRSGLITIGVSDTHYY